MMRALLCLVLFAGCADPPTAYFSAPGGTPGDDFYALPFPNDLRRHDDGTLDLSAFPTNSVIATSVRDVAERELDGFGLNQAMFARFSAPLDPASLPTPEDSITDKASVYLVNIDADSPDRGTRTPVIATFYAEGTHTMGDNRLAVRPVPGFGLDEGTTYALVITTRVRGDNGESVARDGDFDALMGSGGSAAIAKARDVYAPLLAYLDETGGDGRGDVASAAVFTTQHATQFGPALRKGVYATPAPVATDVVLGAMTDNLTLWTGNYMAPNFQQGEPPYISTGGEIVIGADGSAVMTRMEPMRFALTVPAGPTPPTGWPICLYQHGTGGDWQSFVEDGTADRLAQVGIAVISTDQVLHGDRGKGTDPSIAFFNFNNPVAGRDNPLQGAADAWSQQRLALDLSIADQDRTRTLTFDPDRVYFFGHSQGGLTGPAYIAFEPAVKGAILSGTGGTFVLGVLHKTKPVDFPSLIATLIRDEPVNEDNPTLALAQMAMERSDGINYAPFMVRRPQMGPDGTTPLQPRNIFHTEGFDDTYSPNPALEAFAGALGGDLVQLPDARDIEGLTLRGRGIVPTPITGNVNGVTAVTAQYKQLSRSDGHYVVFDIAAARKQSAQFLGTLAATGKATVVSP